MAVVKLENVSKSWGDFKAVDDFNLTIKETLSTWTVMETSIGISGLIGVLILNQLI